MHLPVWEHAVDLNSVPSGFGFRRINDRKGKPTKSFTLVVPVLVDRGLNALMLSS